MLWLLALNQLRTQPQIQQCPYGVTKRHRALTKFLLGEQDVNYQILRVYTPTPLPSFPPVCQLGGVAGASVPRSFLVLFSFEDDSLSVAT